MKGKIITTALLSAAVTLSGCAAIDDELLTNTEEESAVEAQNVAEESGQSEEIEESAYNQESEENEETIIVQETPVKSYAVYIKVTGDGVNIRSGAGTGYSSLGAAEKGTLYACLGESGGWYRTLYQNRTAYISSKYCEVVQIEQSDNADAENAIAVGLSLLGTEYVYGAVRCHDGYGNLLSGFTLSAFDCSSLVQYMFYAGAGVLLQVNTRTQIYQGEHVEADELQRGDLLFFTNDSRYYNSGIERVGHVAVYLGDNYILHTASDYAKIEQISAKRRSYFIEARRVV